MVEVGPRGGTNQARYERDVLWDSMLARLKQLHLGDAALCFGRIDFEGPRTVTSPGRGAGNGNGDGDNGHGEGGNGNGASTDPDAVGEDGSFYIGRVAVADQHQEPVIVGWRAP